MTKYLFVGGDLFPIDTHHLARLEAAGLIRERVKGRGMRGVHCDDDVALIDEHAGHHFSSTGGTIAVVGTGGMSVADANALYHSRGERGFAESTFYRKGKLLRSHEGPGCYWVRELEFLEIDPSQDTLTWKSAWKE